MTTNAATIPESCTQCPHFERFRAACTHPLRQVALWELRDERSDCPLFETVRAEAMRDLEQQLD